MPGLWIKSLERSFWSNSQLFIDYNGHVSEPPPAHFPSVRVKVSSISSCWEVESPLTLCWSSGSCRWHHWSLKYFPYSSWTLNFWWTHSKSWIPVLLSGPEALVLLDNWHPSALSPGKPRPHLIMTQSWPKSLCLQVHEKTCFPLPSLIALFCFWFSPHYVRSCLLVSPMPASRTPFLHGNQISEKKSPSWPSVCCKKGEKNRSLEFGKQQKNQPHQFLQLRA